MPQRRAPFAYGMSDGESTGANPTMAMPYTGTGTQPLPDEQLDPTVALHESPATLRRRLMPIAGAPQMEPDVLQAVQQMLAQRRGQ